MYMDVVLRRGVEARRMSAETPESARKRILYMRSETTALFCLSFSPSVAISENGRVGQKG